MPTVAEVNAAYQASVEELQTILETPGVTSKQRKATELALQDLFVLHGAHVIQEIDGRTALLSGLIAELEEVIKAIQVNPIGDAMEKLNSVLGTAKNLYDKEKKNLAGA